MKMLPAERVKAALEGNDFDVYPVINPVSVATSDAMERARAFFPSAHINSMEIAALASIGHDYYGFDSVTPYFSTHLEASALGAQVDWKNASQMPVVVKKSIGCLDDFEIPQSFLGLKEFQCLLKACDILKKKYGGRVPIIGKVMGPWTLAYNLYGIENLVLDTILEPAKTKNLINELAEIPLKFAEAQFDAGADMITWVDLATSDLVSAAVYEEFLLPVHVKAASRLQKKGPVILHICGNIMDRFNYIIKTGFKLFHMDSRNNIASAMKQAESLITITGCINNPVTLYRGDPVMIRKEVEANIKSGIRIISPECTLPVSIPDKTIKFLTETVHHLQPPGGKYAA